MGCILGSSNQDLHELQSQPQKSRTADEREACIIRLKLERDKITRKTNDLEKQMTALREKARGLARENKKQQAMYYLTRWKGVKQNLNKYNQRILMIENRAQEMETVMDDIQFTKMLDESNQQMRELLDQVNYDAIEEAKQLSEEVDFNNQQVMGLLEQGNNDEELLKEYDMLDQLGRDMQQSEPQTRPQVNNQQQQYQAPVQQKEEPQMMLA